MSTIKIGDNIKGRIVEEINGACIVARDQVSGNLYFLHEIQSYNNRRCFLVINWKDHLFEIQDIK